MERMSDIMSIISTHLKKFTEIYSDYYPVVYNGIYAKLRNTDSASDLAQEVFIRFYEKMESVENPRAWLLGALRMVLFEYYRRNKGDEIDIDEVFEDSNIRYVNGFRDTRIIIQQAMDETENYQDERDRIIFDLIAINNYTTAEVSRQMGLTERQVRYRYSRVVDRIMDHLRKRGVKNLEDLL